MEKRNDQEEEEKKEKEEEEDGVDKTRGKGDGGLILSWMEEIFAEALKYEDTEGRKKSK